MSVEGHPAADNIFYLQHGIRLVRRLDDRLFAGRAEDSPRRGVGAQFRHCIDFYNCFLDGLTDGRVDYNRRARDARVEVERQHAIACTEAVVERLARVNPQQVEAGLLVRMERPPAADRQLSWCRSSCPTAIRPLLCI